MKKKININQQSLMELDIDERISYLWEIVDTAIKNGNISDLETIGSLLRAAYGQGYVDALKEPRGQLQRDHGFAIPDPFDSKKE